MISFSHTPLLRATLMGTCLLALAACDPDFRRFGRTGFYTSYVAQNLAAILDIIGQATLGIGALVGGALAIPLYDWYRKAELSADRAALLCVQDKDVAIRTFMKLAGGAAKLYEEMDQDEFIRQIRAYDDADGSQLNKAYKVLITVFRTHPFPIMRAKHLDAWIQEGGFSSIAGFDLEAE